MDSRTALGGYGPGEEWITAEPLASARKYFPRVLTGSMTVLFLEFLIEGFAVEIFFSDRRI
jgi:hypothetical protein